MQFNLHNEIYLSIASAIEAALVKEFDSSPLNTTEIYKLLSPPPKSGMGDLAFPCFPLAKVLKLGPPQIAGKLLESFGDFKLIESCKAFGPYLNFYFNTEEIGKYIIPKINSKEYFKTNLVASAPKSIIEFSQPNTHKELHVGHMRNLCLGDALVKFYRYAGIETLSTTFPGDVGTHVAKCLWYYKEHNTESAPEVRKGAWLGSLYTKANNLLEEQLGSDKEEGNRAALTLILKELHAGSGEYYDLWQETRNWSIELMKEVYTWANVEFDSWYWESDVDAASVSLINEYYEKGLFIKDKGAIGINLEEEKLGFCLLLKSDGTGLYATKDIELARRKFEDHKVERSIYVVDNRQALHFKQVFNVLGKMGFENSKNCHHLQYEMVELPSGAMSSRKGNVVALQKLIDEMERKIKTDYLARYTDEWTPEEIEKTAHIVAAGSIKYGMTRVDSNKKIIFDISEWLKLDGESGPYIQYVHARINSMIAKAEFNESSCDFSLLEKQIEKDIIGQLLGFNAVMQSCIEQSKTHLLCHYLYSLAKSFNTFYAECPILKEEEALKQTRLALAMSVKTTLCEGLALLGIEAPLKM
jgi:arginyl-tRNA synthetase